MNNQELIEKWGDVNCVLDHGHVRLIDLMGDDRAIVQAARVSYGGGESEHKWNTPVTRVQPTCKVCGVEPPAFGVKVGPCLEGDRRLIRYMMSHRHTSPFEQCEIKLHCKMPIFVARQWVRHRTASLNEISGRYAMLPDEFYVPEPERVGGKGKDNKQGTEGVLDRLDVEAFRTALGFNYKNLRDQYATAGEKAGIANELARLHTGVGQYTEWYWKIDLHNLLHFLSLRLDPHAQWETRQYAQAIWEIVQDWVPMTAEAFTDYRLEAETFSRMELQAVRQIVAHLRELYESEGILDQETVIRMLGQIAYEEGEMGSKREREAFLRKLGVL
jgi:thymidylate synthase (FAD)